MREDKTKLTPINLPDEDGLTEAQKQARRELMKERQRTEKFKRDYFDYYDDVKIGPREDW